MLYFMFIFEPIHLYNKIDSRKVTSWSIFMIFLKGNFQKYGNDLVQTTP